MTKDYMKSATMMDYTAFDIGYAAFSRGNEQKLKKMAKRAARRINKNSLKKFLTK